MESTYYWNLSALIGVVPVLFHEFGTLRGFLPRAALAAILLILGIFAFFEGVYLADQSAEFHSVRIVRWRRVFRVLAILLIGCSAFTVIA